MWRFLKGKRKSSSAQSSPQQRGGAGAAAEEPPPPPLPSSAPGSGARGQGKRSTNDQLPPVPGAANQLATQDFLDMPATSSLRIYEDGAVIGRKEAIYDVLSTDELGSRTSSSRSSASASASTSVSVTQASGSGVGDAGRPWTCEEVCGWLRRIDLAHCCDAFLHHKVDGVVLSHLSVDNLKDIGIEAFGDRVRIMNAVETLRAKSRGGGGRDTPSTSGSVPGSMNDLTSRSRSVTPNHVALFNPETGQETIYATVPKSHQRLPTSALTSALASAAAPSPSMRPPMERPIGSAPGLEPHQQQHHNQLEALDGSIHGAAAASPGEEPLSLTQSPSTRRHRTWLFKQSPSQQQVPAGSPSRRFTDAAPGSAAFELLLMEGEVDTIQSKTAPASRVGSNEASPTQGFPTQSSGKSSTAASSRRSTQTSAIAGGSASTSRQGSGLQLVQGRESSQQRSPPSTPFVQSQQQLPRTGSQTGTASQQTAEQLHISSRSPDDFSKQKQTTPTHNNSSEGGGFFQALRRSFRRRSSKASNEAGSRRASARKESSTDASPSARTMDREDEGEEGALGDSLNLIVVEGIMSRVDPTARRSGYYLGLSDDTYPGELLRGAVEGAFLIHSRSGDDRHLVITFVARMRIRQVIVVNTPGGLVVEGFDDRGVFPVLSRLVQFFGAEGSLDPGSLLYPGLEAAHALPQPVPASSDFFRSEWYYGSIGIDDARTLLEFEQNGVFLVRNSARNTSGSGSTVSSPTAFELLFAYSGRVHSRTIIDGPTGVHLDPGHSFFENLSVLVSSYMTSPSDELPCTLRHAPGAVPPKRAKTSSTSVDTVVPVFYPSRDDDAPWWAGDAQGTREAVRKLLREPAVDGLFFVRFGHVRTSFVLTYLFSGRLHCEFIHSNCTSVTVSAPAAAVYLARAKAITFRGLQELVRYYSTASRPELHCALSFGGLEGDGAAIDSMLNLRMGGDESFRARTARSQEQERDKAKSLKSLMSKSVPNISVGNVEPGRSRVSGDGGFGSPSFAGSPYLVEPSSANRQQHTYTRKGRSLHGDETAKRQYGSPAAFARGAEEGMSASVSSSASSAVASVSSPRNDNTGTTANGRRRSSSTRNPGTESGDPFAQISRAPLSAARFDPSMRTTSTPSVYESGTTGGSTPFSSSQGTSTSLTSAAALALPSARTPQTSPGAERRPSRIQNQQQHQQHQHQHQQQQQQQQQQQYPCLPSQFEASVAPDRQGFQSVIQERGPFQGLRNVSGTALHTFSRDSPISESTTSTQSGSQRNMALPSSIVAAPGVGGVGGGGGGGTPTASKALNSPARLLQWEKEVSRSRERINAVLSRREKDDQQKSSEPPLGLSSGQTTRFQEAPSWPWYQVGVPREQALQFIRGKPDGAFVIRYSETRVNSFVLSYMFEDRTRHEVISTPSGDLTKPGIKLESAPHKTFDNIHDLLKYHCRISGVLMCPLLLPAKPIGGKSSKENLELTKPLAGSPLVAASDGGAGSTLRDASKRIDEGALRAPWFCLGMPREQALSRLRGGVDGEFIIRDSPGFFGTLTMRYHGRLYQAHIEDSEMGLHLKKSNVYRSTLSQLVAFHAQDTQTDLPCPLLLHAM